MIKGLYSAASGMVAMEARMDVVANNVANAATPGFRRQRDVQVGFHDLFFKQLQNAAVLNTVRGPGGGTRFIATYTDTEPGPLTVTGDPLHVALQGPAYIGVTTPQGERFTRSGAFTVDADGELATPDGYKVQGAGGGPVFIGEGPVTIDALGTVSVNGEPAGQLRLVEFEDPRLLVRTGQSLYAASEDALDRSAPAVATQVVQKSLEQSNVQAPRELLDMTLALRAYQANERVISAVDSTVSRLIDQVATPS